MSQHALKLLAALSKALAHRIRSPLSVISNDLSYFGSTIPPAELTQSTEKISVINSILKGISGLREANLSATHSLAIIWSPLFAADGFVTERSPDFERLSLPADLNLLHLAIKLLVELLLEIRDSSQRPIQASLSVSDNGNWHTRFATSNLSKLKPSRPGCTLISERINLELSLDTTGTPMMDAIFLAHSWGFTFEESHLVIAPNVSL